MKTVATIPVNKHTIEELETLHYCVESYKDIISLMISNGTNEGDGWARYMTEYGKIFKTYNAFKNRITDTVVPDAYKDSRYTWQADFDNHTIIILEA